MAIAQVDAKTTHARCAWALIGGVKQRCKESYYYSNIFVYNHERSDVSNLMRVALQFTGSTINQYNVV